MNVRQLAVMTKDIRGVTLNKQVFAVLLVVPLALVIVLPSIFVLVTAFAPDAASDFQKILDMLPTDNGARSQQQRIFGLILNNIMPVFFLMIPIMASSVMAASSFVGEKEKHTLETLLYSPAVAEADVSGQDTGRVFRRDDGFVYIIRRDDAGAGAGSVPPDRQGNTPLFKLAGDHASYRPGDIHYRYRRDRAQLRKGADH